jgi:co-chaperonin GroES (HSP10)
VNIGPDVTNLKEGDKVLLPSHGNTPVSWKGEVYHVFREISIFAKING